MAALSASNEGVCGAERQSFGEDGSRRRQLSKLRAGHGQRRVKAAGSPGAGSPPPESCRRFLVPGTDENDAMIDSVELERSLREHGDGLRALATALVQPADADDALQQVWLEALRAGPRRTGPIGGWLRTVLQHVIGNDRRRGRRREQRHLVAAARSERLAEDPAVAVERAELTQRLLCAVLRLAPQYRDAIWRRYFQGQPPRAIARELGEPLVTIKSRLHRGLLELRQQLGERGDADWRLGLATAFSLRPATAAGFTWFGGLAMSAGSKVLLWCVPVACLVGLLAWFATPPAVPAPTAPAEGPLAEVAVAPHLPMQRTAVVAEVPPAAAAAANEPPSEAAIDRVRVQGRLVDAGTKAPLVGVRVTWHREQRSASSADDPGVETDADGRFGLDVALGQWSVYVAAFPPHFVGRWEPLLGLAAGQIEDLGEWALRPGRDLGVRVIDADSGAGVGGVRVGFTYPHDSVPGFTSGTDGTSDATGALVLGNRLPRVAVGVAVWDGDHELVAPAQVDLAADAPQDVTVSVRRRATIRGTVVDERGAPIAGVGLSVAPAASDECESGDDGSFLLVKRPPANGATATIAIDDSQLFLPPQALTNVAWGRSDLRIELRRPVPFAVEVVDDQGQPVEQFAVSLDRAGMGRSMHLLRQRGPHAGGRVMVEGVMRGATSLRIVPAAIELAPSGPMACDGDEPLRVVVARRPACRVLVERAGAPVPGVCVEYVHERQPLDQHGGTLNDPRDRAAPVQPAWPELVAAAQTGADGIAALFRDTETQHRALRLRLGDEPVQIVRDLQFPEDGSPLRVELAGSGRIAGRVTLAGRSRRDVQVRMRSGEQFAMLMPQPDGSFGSGPLAVGSWRVDVVVRTGPGQNLVPFVDAAGDVAVTAGQMARIDFDLSMPSLARVQGRLTSDRPLPEGLVVDLIRTDAEGAQTKSSGIVAADGTFQIVDLWSGNYQVAYRLASSFMPALQPEPLVLVGGEERVLALHFVHRKLTVHFVRPDGSPARGHRTLARCGGTTWPQMLLFVTPLDEKLVLDPAPALPIEFGGAILSRPWSAPVTMPTDRREAEVTVVLQHL